MKQANEIIEYFRTHDTILLADVDGFSAILDYRGTKYQVIASWGMDWDHVSVTIHDQKRAPTWDEMCFVKDLFWPDTETVIQYHPERSRYVNTHPYVLHLWRPQSEMIPMPPSIMV